MLRTPKIFPTRSRGRSGKCPTILSIRQAIFGSPASTSTPTRCRKPKLRFAAPWPRGPNNRKPGSAWWSFLPRIEKVGNPRGAARCPQAIAGGSSQSGARSGLRIDRRLCSGRATLLGRFGSRAGRSLHASHRRQLLRPHRPQRSGSQGSLYVLREAGKDPKYAAHLLWARRTLATLIAASGSYQDFVKAKALLAENVKASGSDPEDKLRLADLLGSRVGEPSAWEEAVKLLESIKTLSPASQMKLAHFHEVLGDWTDARAK